MNRQTTTWKKSLTSMKIFEIVIWGTTPIPPFLEIDIDIVICECSR